MKNQYVGDINDYRKYGLLRLLSRNGLIKIAVCWMLTPNNGRSNGRFIAYLRYPLMWRQYDPELYISLRKTVIDRRLRNVMAVEEARILPYARFYSDTVPDDSHERQAYFETFIKKAHGCDLIFFDPDNGIEVKSIPYGRKGSSKYVYWKEIQESFSAGHSIIIYQHFPRIKRNRFIKNIARRLASETGARQVFSFRTAYVLFLLACRESHEKLLQDGVKDIAKKWEPQFCVSSHTFRK